MESNEKKGVVVPFKKEPRLSSLEQFSKFYEEVKPKDAILITVDEEGNLNGFVTPGLNTFELIGILAASVHETTNNAANL